MDTEQELRESFKSISDSLNTTFSFGDIDTDKTLQVLEDKKNELMSLDIKNEVKTIEDKEFLDTTIKVMIDIGLTVLKKVSQDIKMGAKYGKISEFAEAFSSVLESIKELKVFKKMIYDMDIPQDQFGGAKNVTINNIFSSKDLLKEVNEITKKTTIDEVKPEFDLTMNE